MNAAERVRVLSRNEVTAAMRKALRRRSGKAWSVTGSTGTAYGWLRIDSPPARRVRNENDIEPTPGKQGYYMSKPEREELAKLLGLEPRAYVSDYDEHMNVISREGTLADCIHFQGVQIKAHPDDYAHWLERCETGKAETDQAAPWWD